MNRTNSYLLPVLFLLTSVFSVFTSFSQIYPDTTQTRVCFTPYMEKLNAAKFPTNTQPVYREETAIEADEFYVIPVVVHVIHNGGVENISDELIISQINVLNEDFGHYGIYNQDLRGEDAHIRFCLAKKDPSGFPTTGIIRIQSALTDLVSDQEMETKNLSYWDPKRYMNIWIVKTIDGSSNIQGYAYTPRSSGGPAFEGDGLVMVYKYFGRGGGFDLRYNLGRTTTHETGHYLDLIHIWGRDEAGKGGCDDDDGIYDTPNCSLSYFSKPPECSHPNQCGNVRMIENFLDYSLDGCMKLFTLDQGTKMRSSISKYRSELVSYDNIKNAGCLDLYDSINSNSRVDIYPNPTHESITFITHYSKGKSDLNYMIFDMFGNILIKHTISNIGKQTVSQGFPELRPGLYLVKGDFAGENFSYKVIFY